MITRVYGSCNEFTIEFQRREGSDLEIWDAIVPADKDGQYVIEVYAESSGGLTAYAATVQGTKLPESSCHEDTRQNQRTLNTVHC